MSTNLNHNVPAIWAHLEPIMKQLSNSVENVYFLSDGPVTQYRNKYMFFFLACYLPMKYKNIKKFSWNYHEAGHRKGAPDEGDTCSHYRLGRINYPFDYPKYAKLSVDDIYSDSDSEAAGSSNEKINEDSNDSVYKNGDYVLVKFEKKNHEYRYAAVCSKVYEDEEEIFVTFLNVCNEEATLFKVDEKDVSHISHAQICQKLPQPDIVLQGNRVFYNICQRVDVSEE
ncbi:hypothetical protein HHI36_006343 [Cryptolaemus montrouzieri]|uniref:Uncharacterized protein n=1 Tax=Cryptolaemus montrouzieri TaxID=559131 RepID=A0ABD2NWV4_9CUCU